MLNENALRILAITSRPLINANGSPITLLDVVDERRRIRDALKNAGVAVHVHFLSDATTGAINEVLEDAWDVIHITGHGTPDGCLLFEDEFGVAQLVDAQDLVRMFGKYRPSVVVLSLCFSGRAAPDHLLKAGINTVVAIRADVPIADRAAMLFNQQFYSSLARGEIIENAFNRAQTSVALDAQVGDEHSPINEAGMQQMPWSKRFTLLGNDAFAFTEHVRGGGYSEAGSPHHAGNLRERNVNFVGRAKEIVEVVKSFDASKARRVAIWGSGGLGKTELSRAVAWWYAERSRVDAVLWASAGRAEGEYILRDLASLLSIAARAFNLNFSEQMPFDQQKAVMREFFASQRSALIILDNWETIEPRDRRQIWDFVLDLPESTSVLVTSRDILPAKDACNLELNTLTIEDSAALFLKIAHNTGYFKRNPRLSGEERGLLNEIIKRLDGYPLAVEVVAGQTESRTLEEIWNGLVKFPENVLQGKDEITGEPRGVWTSLGFSYDVLPAPEQAMFRMMGVFLSPATSDDITAIAQIENSRTVLDTLVKRSLVRTRDGTYTLLPIVRDYAESRILEAHQVPAELHVRVANHYLKRGTLEDKVIASDHLFEIATRFGVEGGPEMFFECVNEFYQDLVPHGMWMEYRRKMEQMIAIAPMLSDRQIEAASIGNLGAAYARIGEYQRAGDLIWKAVNLCKEIDDKLGLATSLEWLGILAEYQEKFEEAERFYNQCLELGEELGDNRLLSGVLHQLGSLASRCNDLDNAEKYFRQSLIMDEESEDKRGVAISLVSLGSLALLNQNHEEASRLINQSLQITRKFGYKPEQALALYNLGTLAYIKGKLEEASQCYQESLNLKMELGDNLGVSNTLRRLGVLARSQGRMHEALEYFLDSIRILPDEHPDYEQLLNEVESIRYAVGEEKFVVWKQSHNQEP